MKEEQRLQEELNALGAARSDGVSPDEREALLRLGADVERAWHAEGATIATRKRIVRMLIEEIVVRIEQDSLDLVIRWTGDDHTALRVRKNRKGQHRWSVDADIVELVRSLARQTSDPTIAAILNRAGTTTGKGNSWTRSRVATLRKRNNITVYREGERAERGETTLDEAAEALNVSPATIRRLIADGVLPARQHCKGAPYVILVTDLQTPRCRQRGRCAKKTFIATSAVCKSGKFTLRLSIRWRDEHYDAGSVPPTRTTLRCWATKPPLARSRTSASLTVASVEVEVVDVLGEGQLGDGNLIFDRARLLFGDLGLEQIADDARRFMLPLDAVANASS